MGSGFAGVMVVVKQVLFYVAAAAAVVALIDWLARTRRINPFGPVAQFMRKVVDPVMLPIERRLVRSGGQPSSAPWWTLVVIVVGGLLLIYAIEFVAGMARQLSHGLSSGRGAWILIVSWSFGLLRAALIIRVVSTWFQISPYSKWIHWTYPLTEWMLKPLRRILPMFGPVDLSPIIAFILLGLVESLLLRQ